VGGTKGEGQYAPKLTTELNLGQRRSFSVRVCLSAEDRLQLRNPAEDLALAQL
jgi:hypothetical protein